MNTNLASFIVGIITDENDRFTLFKRTVRFTLFLEEKRGRMNRSICQKDFAYSDMKQLRLTTLEVTATQGNEVWLAEQ